MKVGLIIYGSLETLSGGYLYDRKLVEHLRSEGDEVEVLSLPWRGYARHLRDNLSRSFVARILEGAFDVLVQDELNHPSLFLLNKRLRRRRACPPIVSIVHHLRCSEARSRIENMAYRQVERSYLQSVDGFVFNSQTTRRVVERVLLGSRPHVVAYPGADRLGPGATAEEIALRADAPGPLRLLFLGNVIRRKGLLTLLQALTRLPRGDWRLEVVGSLTVESDHVSEIAQEVEALALTDRVRLHGAVEDDADLVTFMKSCHALVVPSTYEGFGIVYMEAAAFGLPSIASSAGAAKEIVTHAQSGFIVPPGDPDAVARHLRTWLEDRPLMGEMGRAARSRFESHPTWAQSAADIRAFLLEMTR